MNNAQVFACSQLIPRFTQQDNDIPFIPEPLGQERSAVIEKPYHAYDRCGVYPFSECLIVKTDISACDRGLKGVACLDHSLNETTELPHDLRLFRIAEIEAVGYGEGLCSGADEIPGRLGNSCLSALVRVKVAVAAVSVQGHGKTLF